MSAQMAAQQVGFAEPETAATAASHRPCCRSRFPAFCPTETSDTQSTSPLCRCPQGMQMTNPVARVVSRVVLCCSGKRLRRAFAS